jgi:hypothetical protein
LLSPDASCPRDRALDQDTSDPILAQESVNPAGSFGACNPQTNNGPSTNGVLDESESKSEQDMIEMLNKDGPLFSNFRVHFCVQQMTQACLTIIALAQ